MKTTTSLPLTYYRLLDVLADRKAKKGLSGHVLINGRRQPRNFKCASAYVVQASLCACMRTYIRACVCVIEVDVDSLYSSYYYTG